MSDTEAMDRQLIEHPPGQWAGDLDALHIRHGSRRGRTPAGRDVGGTRLA